jgi:16S rRNA (adenine1518-N6/adenine1519-N6)-dimethyltransferase
MVHPPTQTEIREMMAEAGLRPDRRYGQHFLVDGNLMRLLVKAADLGPTDTVLEVGPGIGNLTELLVEQAGCVVAVEIDPRVATIAHLRLADAGNLDLVQGDILAGKRTLAPEVLEILAERQGPLGGPVKLVANLPYSAATPLVAEMVVLDPPPERLVFTVQEEVAMRLAAEPGTHDYGPVGVLVQGVAEVELLRRLSPSVFWPRPKVWSSMVRVTPRADRRRRIADLKVFRRTIEGLFAHRRKRAARSLSLADAAPSPGLRPPSPTLGERDEMKGASPAEWAARLTAAGLDPEARGEAYSVEEIIRLANSLARA